MHGQIAKWHGTERRPRGRRQRRFSGLVYSGAFSSWFGALGPGARIFRAISGELSIRRRLIFELCFEFRINFLRRKTFKLERSVSKFIAVLPSNPSSRTLRSKAQYRGPPEAVWRG
jgi:hypothetical protein